MAYVIDILRGADTERIRNLGHDRLSTYGIGAHLAKDAWTSLFRQLIHRGYLRQDIADYSVLKLTEAARPLLAGEERLELARPWFATGAGAGGLDGARSGRGQRSRRSRGGESGVLFDASVEFDPGLYEQLRTLRRRLADEQGVPAYVVFSDATLQEMAVLRPATPDQLLAVNGVGEVKLERYGAAFLEALTRA